MAIDDFQKKLLKKLREYKEESYPDASIYTVLLDLCEGNGVDHIFEMLHNVACDMDKREEMESQYLKSIKWTWGEQ